MRAFPQILLTSLEILTERLRCADITLRSSALQFGTNFANGD
jgi:hypothetical protein